MRILKPFMLLAVIGVLYSCAAVHLQTYRNGYIMDKNNVVVGYYWNGYLLDLEKNIIGYYANGYIYDTRHEVIGNYVNGYIKNLKLNKFHVLIYLKVGFTGSIWYSVTPLLYFENISWAFSTNPFR